MWKIWIKSPFQQYNEQNDRNNYRNDQGSKGKLVPFSIINLVKIALFQRRLLRVNRLVDVVDLLYHLVLNRNSDRETVCMGNGERKVPENRCTLHRMINLYLVERN